MRFGLNLGLSPHAGQTVQDALRDRDELMEIADAGGFGRLWFLEHHFIPTVMSPAPLMEVAHVATKTKNTRLGTSVILSPFHHPLLLAEEIALADHLSKGRLDVGFGRGASVLEANRMGIMSFVESGERQEELLEILFGVWEKDAEFSYKGKYNNFGPTRPLPRPLQLPHPPLWLAGRSVESMRFCAATGIGLMTTGQDETMQHTRDQLKLLDTLIEDVGAPGRPPLSHVRRVFISEDPKEVRAYLETLAPSSDPGSATGPKDVRALSGLTVLEGANAAEMNVDPLTAEALMERHVVGDPETVLRKFREFADMGFDEFTAAQGGYQLGSEWHEKEVRSVRYMTEYVIPHFKDAPVREATPGHRSLKDAFISRDPAAEGAVARAYGLGDEWRGWSTDDWVAHCEREASVPGSRALFVFDANLAPRVKGDRTGYIDTAGTLMLIRGQSCPDCDRPVLAVFHRRKRESLEVMREAIRREVKSVQWHANGHAVPGRAGVASSR